MPTVSIDIVGMRYQPGYERRLRRLHLGGALVLRPDPTYTPDPNTVKVTTRWMRRTIGYVRAKQAPAIHLLLEKEPSLVGTISVIDPAMIKLAVNVPDDICDLLADEVPLHHAFQQCKTNPDAFHLMLSNASIEPVRVRKAFDAHGILVADEGRCISAAQNGVFYHYFYRLMRTDTANEKTVNDLMTSELKSTCDHDNPQLVIRRNDETLRSLQAFLKEAEGDKEEIARLKPIVAQVNQDMEENLRTIDSLEKAERERDAAVAEAQKARTAALLLPGNERELFAHELRGMVCAILTDSLKKLPPTNCRRRVVVEDLLKANKKSLADYDRRLAELESTLRNQGHRTEGSVRFLRKQGFNVTDGGKHYKITLPTDTRYNMTMSCTPSAGSAGESVFRDLLDIFY